MGRRGTQSLGMSYEKEINEGRDLCHGQVLENFPP